MSTFGKIINEKNLFGQNKLIQYVSVGTDTHPAFTIVFQKDTADKYTYAYKIEDIKSLFVKRCNMLITKEQSKAKNLLDDNSTVGSFINELMKDSKPYAMQEVVWVDLESSGLLSGTGVLAQDDLNILNPVQVEGFPITKFNTCGYNGKCIPLFNTKIRLNEIMAKVNAYCGSQQGGNRYVTVLGRKRKVTKVGRKNMIVYKGKQISLGEARVLEKQLTKKK